MKGERRGESVCERGWEQEAGMGHGGMEGGREQGTERGLKGGWGAEGSKGRRKVVQVREVVSLCI